MSAEDVDEYLRAVEEPKRSTLQALRETILEIVPDAEQVISYRVPAFRVGGKTVAGFAAFRFCRVQRSSELPAFQRLHPRAAGRRAKGLHDDQECLHFPVGSSLPKALVEKLIAVRLGEIEQRSR